MGLSPLSRPASCRLGFVAAFLLLLTAAASANAASILERGLIDCFTPLLAKDSGKLVHCEASAVAAVEGKLLLAIDKAVPGEGRSSVVLLDRIGGSPRAWSNRYLRHPAILAARKFEAMTVTPDGGWILASTAFDRIKASAKWDPYNTLLAWPVEKKWKTEAQVVAGSSREGVESSRGLRDKFSEALGGIPYFKIEGLAMLPDGLLLFGVREAGASFDRFDYVAKVIGVSAEIGAKGVTLGDDVALVYEPPQPLESEGRTVALSSLEYDRFNDRLYLLTSYEEEKTDEGIGGYLWTLPMAAFRAGEAPTLALKPDGKPLRFAHKSEGLAVIDAKHVIVIHVDDRVLGREVVEDPESQFHRLPHQAAYTVVRVD